MNTVSLTTYEPEFSSTNNRLINQENQYYTPLSDKQIFRGHYSIGEPMLSIFGKDSHQEISNQEVLLVHPQPCEDSIQFDDDFGLFFVRVGTSNETMEMKTNLDMCPSIEAGPNFCSVVKGTLSKQEMKDTKLSNAETKITPISTTDVGHKVFFRIEKDFTRLCHKAPQPAEENKQAKSSANPNQEGGVNSELNLTLSRKRQYHRKKPKEKREKHLDKTDEQIQRLNKELAGRKHLSDPECKKIAIRVGGGITAKIVYKYYWDQFARHKKLCKKLKQKLGKFP
jgi:hypothetical protein